MADDSSGGAPKPMKNSLLSAAATGFTFEDSAALLVPVSLQDDTDLPVISEIDLKDDNDDILQEELSQLSYRPDDTFGPNPAASKSGGDSSLISLFSKSAMEDNDPFSLMISSTGTAKSAVPPSTINEGIRESKSSDSLFSLSNLWSSGRASAPTGQSISPAPTMNQSQGFSLSGFLTGGLSTNNAVESTMPHNISESVPTSLSSESLYVANSPSYSSPNLLSHATDALEESQTQAIINANPSLPPKTVPGGLPKVNNFRLGSQKPTYAQYPGLIESTVQGPASTASTAPPLPGYQGFSSSGFLTGDVSTNNAVDFTVPQTTPESVPTSSFSQSSQVANSSSFSMPSPNLLSNAKDAPEGGQQLPGLNINQNQSLPPMTVPGALAKANNFRLGSQKPTYAQYPGLTGSNVQGSALNPLAAPPPPGNGSSKSQPIHAFVPPVPNSTQPIHTFVPTMPNSAPVFTPYDSMQSTMPQNKIEHNSNYSNPSFGMHGASTRSVYSSVTFHWFYRKEIDGRQTWKPFSMMDSVALEHQFTSNTEDFVSTDGGRYDVDVKARQKMPIYWDEAPSEVRRCSWFYKGPLDSRYIPYDEELSQRLESEFQQAMTTGVWHKRLEFPDGEAIVLHNPNAMAHFCKAAAPDEWGNLPESQLRPRVIKRGVEEFEIDDGEAKQIDHLVFLVHGIGAICDFKLRTIVEAVDDFRHLSVKLMHSHFKDSVDSQTAGRIEFLPVSWHKALHGDGGIDKKLKPITLNSIPKLRNFTNDTLLDILFYTSPVYAQTIVDTVGNELNRLFNLFLSRNPTFNGYVALSGHSLGSLILFDLLSHQPKIGRQENPNSSEVTLESTNDKPNEGERTASAVSSDANDSMIVSYTVGNGTGQPVITYPVLEFEPTAFFALGSPIAMFVTVRGIDKLGENFHFPTCPAFFNIFHPFDPVAYRIEMLIEPNCDLRPLLIPHHKGRKRFHLELKETMQRVSSDIKQKFLESLKTTWNTVYQLATFSKGDNFEQEMDRVIEGELVKKSEEAGSDASGGEDLDQDVGFGKLNGGRRVDYVLQEAPLESFNEYLFALSSHVCYWESEDTMLMIMREIYASMGIFADKQQTVSTSTNLPKSMHHQNLQSSNYPHASAGINGGSIPAAFPTQISLDHSAEQMSGSNQPYGQSFLSSSTSTPPSAPPLLLNPGLSSTNSSWINPPLGTPIMNMDPGNPSIIGARPVVSPENFASLRGMDPTAPIGASGSVGPPPLKGFVKK